MLAMHAASSLQCGHVVTQAKNKKKKKKRRESSINVVQIKEPSD